MVPLPPLGKVGFSGNRSKSYRGNTHKQFCPYFTLYRKESITSYLPQRGKVADVSAKQIYDRLRSSRMTDEVLQTVFADERQRHRLGRGGACSSRKNGRFSENIISVLGTPQSTSVPQAEHDPPSTCSKRSVCGKAWLRRFLVLQG